MSRHNEGFGICFNDNSGAAGWFATAEGLDEYQRHVILMGRWRAKLFFLYKLWIALRNTERFACRPGTEASTAPRWRSLKGWKP